MGPKCVSNWESLLTFDLGIDLEKSKLSKTNLWGISSWQVLQFDIGLLIDKKDLHVDLQFQDLQNPCWSQRSRSSNQYVKMSVLCRRIKICNHILSLTFFKTKRSQRHSLVAILNVIFCSGSSGVTTCIPLFPIQHTLKYQYANFRAFIQKCKTWIQIVSYPPNLEEMNQCMI